jgi:5-methylcytosine-specific restriction endonuclease McrA
MTYRPSNLYPENWNRMRFAIFKQYNYQCQLCGNYSKGNLQLHHLKPKMLGGSDSPSNLVPLCSNCHYQVSIGNISWYDFRELINSRSLSSD